MRAHPDEQGVVGSYLRLGLAIGRHIDGFIDAYYGPPELRRESEGAPPRPPQALAAEARQLLGAIDGGTPLGAPGDDPAGEVEGRRRFLRAQVLGLLTSARVLAGEHLDYADEVESCYGVRPHRVEEDEILAAHRRLDEVVPGSGPLAERYIAWRESQVVPPDRLESAIASLAEDLRERTGRLFGLPEGESVEFALVDHQPWSGFNYYLGDLRSRVAINTDLPVLSPSLAHLVAHEAYPGHHTEHSRKEVGLVRRRRYLEESIFLVGTPQCLIAEGLADLGLEIVMGRRPEQLVAEHLRPLGIPYDPDTVAVVAEAGEALGAVRANAAFRLHADGADPEVVVDEVARLALLPPERAKKSVEFLFDPTWRAYITCYVEGLPLCRRYVAGDPARFERLITEQCVPAELAA
ncbi:MAG TPA: hypothetical protein VNF07_00045 [Acidimicrobiales bacterium]|nr:hypothetical protein [Acidimicrobiales bacterium]